jgi:hypothetical protein
MDGEDDDRDSVVARLAKPLHRVGEVLLRVRGYEAAQDAYCGTEDIQDANPASPLLRV